MHPQFRSGPGVDLPRVAHSPMVPPLVGGVPVDYGPRLFETRQPPTNFPSKPSHITYDEENVPSKLLWVGNISGDMSEALLTQVFEKFGKVDTVSVYPQRSYAFVEFKVLEDAKAAKAGLQGKAVKGQALRIEFAKPARPGRHLWIWGPNEAMGKEQMEAEFQNFGSLEDFKILRDGKCALAVYKRLEDAIVAKEKLNKKFVRGQELRVDFLRSQPLKRGNTAVETKLQNVVMEEAGRREGVPSETLWISFPSSVRVDEERLRRAFILFGEVERIKIFPDRNYCFVQFRNADEASRAKEGLHGRLFNDPRVQIRFSNSEGISVGVDRVDGSFLSPLHGREGLMHPGLTGLRTNLTGIERFVPSSPKMTMNLPGNSSVLHHDMRGSGSILGSGRQVGAIPTSGFVSNPLTRGGLADARFPFEGTNVHIENRVAMPPANFGNMSELLPARPIGDIGPMPVDKDYIQRESKRPKVSNSSGLLGKASLIDSPILNRNVHESIQRYGRAGNEQLHFQPLRQHSGPLNVDAAQTGIGVLGPGVGVLGPGITGFTPNSGNIEQTKAGNMSNGIWKWRGTIAKAGTFVCRAQSFTVGKGIDIELPEVVNCSARTTLDMLAQHLHRVGNFEVVVFVPDGDSENASYRDFVRYLGDKHRAGVANLGDKITLFLVPPSDFSEKVLKLPGECLFGVIIKSPQVESMQHDHQHLTSSQEQCHLPQLVQPQLKTSMEDNFSSNVKQSAVFSGNLLTPSSQSTSVSLTSELMSSLASLLPVQRHSLNEFSGGLSVSDAGVSSANATTEVSHPGASQRKGVAQAESRPAIKSEISRGNQISAPQMPESGPIATPVHANLISHNPSFMFHQQPTMALPNLTNADAQSHVGQVSGVTNAATGLSSMSEFPTKDLNQLPAPLSEQSQVFVSQSHAQNVQQQMIGNPQLNPLTTAQGGQSESSILGQLSLGHFLQNSGSNGPASTPSTVVGQIAETTLVQGSGAVGNERHNRFQATLQLAAALLQRMQNPSRSHEAPSQ